MYEYPVYWTTRVNTNNQQKQHKTKNHLDSALTSTQPFEEPHLCITAIGAM